MREAQHFHQARLHSVICDMAEQKKKKLRLKF